MSDYTLTIPDDIYQVAYQIAEETHLPVEQVMIDYLRTLPALALLPADEEAELAALQQLSDDALWAMAREQMPGAARQQMSELMDRNSQGTITAEEYEILAQLVDRGERLMLRKSEAGAILTMRGHHVTGDDVTYRG